MCVRFGARCQLLLRICFGIAYHLSFFIVVVVVDLEI